MIHYTIPISILTKATVSPDAKNIGAANDATSFTGSPLTFRATPSIVSRVGEKNTFTTAAILDLRMLLPVDDNNKLYPKIGGYTALGMQYAGDRQVRTADGQYDGKWSVAVMGYMFWANDETKVMLFGDTGIKSGLEGYLKFNVLDRSKSSLDFFVGGQYKFDVAPGEKPWMFRFGVGN